MCDVPAPQRQFCREISLACGEPLLGTGAMPKRVLLLRWPRARWRVPRYESAGMSPALSRAIERVMAAGNHVALIAAEDDGPSLTGFPEARTANPPDDDALVATIEAWGQGGALEGAPEPRITVLCCTDSRRDPCCAKWGHATYRELVAKADRATFNIVQSTHLGGCRFAASLMVLPRRERYGRLAPQDVATFLAVLAGGETFLPAFRGKADASEPDQITLAANPLSPIALRRETFAAPGRCTLIDASPPQTRTRWVGALAEQGEA